jgi:hypothetical protein
MPAQNIICPSDYHVRSYAFPFSPPAPRFPAIDLPSTSAQPETTLDLKTPTKYRTPPSDSASPGRLCPSPSETRQYRTGVNTELQSETNEN